MAPQSASSALIYMRLLVSITSSILTCFYGYQKYKGRCNIHPLYVQSVTAILYTLATFELGGFATTTIKTEDGSITQLNLARYLFWIMTCPVIIFGFMDTLHFKSNHETTKTTFIIVKDILVTVLGILAAKSGSALKYAFLLASLIIYGGMLIEGFTVVAARFEDFKGHPNAIFYLKIICAWMAFSWSIFPILFIIGRPVLGLVSDDADSIGHCICDILAKNILGLMIWCFRFYIVKPIKTEIENNKRPAERAASVVPFYASYGKHFGYRALSKSELQKHGHVLVIEPEIHLQRLLEFVLTHANLTFEILSTIDQACEVVQRGDNDHFDCIFINVNPEGACLEINESMIECKAFLEERPYYLPMIGYTFGVEGEEYYQYDETFHAFAKHILDTKYVASVVIKWKSVSDRLRNMVNPVESLNSIAGRERGQDQQNHSTVQIQQQKAPGQLCLEDKPQIIHAAGAFNSRSSFRSESPKRQMLQKQMSLRSVASRSRSIGGRSEQGSRVTSSSGEGYRVHRGNSVPTPNGISLGAPRRNSVLAQIPSKSTSESQERWGVPRSPCSDNSPSTFYQQERKQQMGSPKRTFPQKQPQSLSPSLDVQEGFRNTYVSENVSPPPPPSVDCPVQSFEPGTTFVSGRFQTSESAIHQRRLSAQQEEMSNISSESITDMAKQLGRKNSSHSVLMWDVEDESQLF